VVQRHEFSEPRTCRSTALSAVQPLLAGLLTDCRHALSGCSGRAAAFFAEMGRPTQAVSLLMMAALQKISGTLKRLADAQASA